ncbi:MAG: hypothetical protein M1812_005807 [Candelaria pacifica]|nr:MAG: hypothetical protein M1812_005807 [Candelaria pacifica]
MTAELVSHLVRQGKYWSDDTAVITPYIEQLQKMRRRMSGFHEVVISDRDAEDLENGGFAADADDPSKPSTAQKTTLLKALWIAIVDSFQDTESLNGTLRETGRVGPITTALIDAHANVTAKTPVLYVKHAVRFNVVTPDATSASNPVRHVLKVLKAHLSFEKPSAFSVKDQQFRYTFRQKRRRLRLCQALI